MTTEAAFLAAIRAEPDDDLHRLVFADWLTDQGQADCAQFIRVQCRLEQIARGSPTTEDEYSGLMVRQFHLLPFGGFGPPEDLFLNLSTSVQLADPDSNGRPVALWRRGFVVEVTCPAKVWTQHSPALVARHPVRAVQLADVNWHMDADWEGDYRFAYESPPVPWPIFCVLYELARGEQRHSPLRPPPPHVVEGVYLREGSTAEDADALLSLAAILGAAREAGLHPEAAHA